MKVLSSILLSTSLSAALAATYDYSKGPNGPAHWAQLFENCRGSEQSPVNIPDSDEFHHDAGINFPAFTFNYAADTDAAFGDIQIINSGKDVDIEFTLEQADKLRLNGAELLPFIVGRAAEAENFLFEMKQIHFHWGSKLNLGSEHTVDGEHYPLEMHIIHFNAGKYPDFETAFGHADGILVVGVLFDVDDESDGNSASEIAMAPLENVFKSSSFTVDASIPSSAFKVSNVVSSLDTSKYYTYKGSLTNPTCDQVITWVVMKDVLKIRESTFGAFRSILDKKGAILQDNFRPVQKGNSRVIFDSESGNFAFVEERDDNQDPAPVEVEKDVSGLKTALGFIVAILVVASVVGAFVALRGSKGKSAPKAEPRKAKNEEIINKENLNPIFEP